MAHADDPFADDGAFDDVSLHGAAHGARGSGFDDRAVHGELMGDHKLSLEDGLRDASGGSSNKSASRVSGVMNSKADAPRATRSRGERAAAEPSGWCGFLSVAYYQHFFDVDTEDVQERLKASVTPWKTDFFALVGDRSDLYGWWWVSSTLVFVIAATSNLSAWLRNDSANDEPWEQDLTKLTFGATFVYGFATVSPLVAWGSFQYLGMAQAQLSVTELACLYGYSLTPFVFASVLCAVPFDEVGTLAAVMAFAFSATFVVRSIWARLGDVRVRLTDDGYEPPSADDSGSLDPPLGDGEAPALNRKTAALLLTGLVGLHAVFALVLKLKFFA
mmetsp:Transcript_11297/g.32067  ORF Transcript_11297/g.32067 Transcript_11297/m.32067 type:complete len:332 (-) Transcript_11297:130-1125(-)